MNRKISCQSGRSMVEMLGVLAIIGVLSVGGIAGYSRAMRQHKVNLAKEQLSLIISNFTYYMQNTGKKKELYNTSFINKFILPPEMINEKGECHHALGGRCLISQNTDGSDRFVVRFGDLDRDSCLQMLSVPLASSFTSVDVKQIGPTTSLSSGYGTQALGASLEQSNAICSDTQNAIRWIM